MILFTAKHEGCYADGTFGADHRRQLLADMLGDIMNRHFDEYQKLQRELRIEPSDDISEEDDALEIINSVTSNATWQMVDGDLMLIGEWEST